MIGMSHSMMWGRKEGEDPLMGGELRLWLDASDQNTLFDEVSGGNLVTSNGASVARWEDKSGNGYHVTQSSSGQRPTLAVAAENGRNCLAFNNDVMVRANADLLEDAFTTLTICINSDNNPTGGDAVHHNLLLTPTGASGASVAMYTRDFGAQNRFRLNARRRSIDGATNSVLSPNNSGFNMMWARLYYATLDPNTKRFAVSNMGSVSVNTNPGITELGNQNISIGSNPSVARHCNGNYAEIRVYRWKNELTNQQYIDVSETILNQLSSKWGVAPI